MLSVVSVDKSAKNVYTVDVYITLKKGVSEVSDLFDENVDSVIDELLKDDGLPIDHGDIPADPDGIPADPDGEFDLGPSESAFKMPTPEEAAETAALESTLEMLPDVDCEIKIEDEEEAAAPEQQGGGKAKKRLIAVLSSLLGLLVILTVVAVFIIKPSFSLLGEENARCEMESGYREEGYEASYLGIDLSGKVNVNGTVDVTKPGEYALDYVLSFLDREYTLRRNVKVVDTTPPKITVTDGTFIETDQRIWEDPGAVAVDNADGDISDKVKVSTDYTPATDGTFKTVYEVTDSAGNKSKAERTVVVHDNYPPEVSLLGTSVLYFVVGDV